MSKQKKARNLNTKQVNNAIIRRYLANKDKIDNAYDYVAVQGSTPLEAFKAEIKETMRIKNVGVAKASDITFRSEIFIPREERLRNNLISAIRNTKDSGEDSAYAKFRAYTRHQKIDINKLRYKGYDGDGSATYEYAYAPEKIIQIVIVHSPEKIGVIKLW